MIIVPQNDEYCIYGIKMRCGANLLKNLNFVFFASTENYYNFNLIFLTLYAEFPKHRYREFTRNRKVLNKNQFLFFFFSPLIQL